MNLNRKDIRPAIKGIGTVLNKGLEETFQNKTLRPIIKMQHDLLVAYFKEYLRQKKILIKTHSNAKQQEYIIAALKKDNALKLELKGIIIGQFTTDEFDIYCSKKSDFNKRILSIIEQRISSKIALF